MLRSRIIPCLLVHNRGLVKTVNFGNPKYVGDPINAVRIFNEKEVDELIVLDIDATAEGREPDYGMIAHLAAECRMPLCYGGGIKCLDQAVGIVKLGVEKVAVSSLALEDPALVATISEYLGRQSVVVVLDVRRSVSSGSPEVWSHNGTRNTMRHPAEVARELQAVGVGEVTVNSIDRDGTMKGYDIDLLREVRASVSVPMTALGGAGSLADIQALIAEFGIVGVAAGSLFVFKGPYRAVLINYPDRRLKATLTGTGAS